MADYMEGMMLPTTARLRRVRYTDDELEQLRKRAKEGAFDEAVLDEAVFFPVIASTNTIDSYSTYMLESTLKNFAEDAAAGVAVLDSHNSRRLNFGMSVSGEVVTEGTGDNQMMYMRSDFYTIPGIQTEGMSTDAYIKGIEAGIFRDVSVGFWMPPGSMIRCSICGKDMMRWWGDNACHHFPGDEYEIEGDGKTRKEVAYGAVDGGRLSEYSLVPDGATPGAGVAKARSMEDAGELQPELALRLERTYHTSFPRATRRYQGVSLIGEHNMGTKTAKPGEKTLAEQLRQAEESEKPTNDEPTNTDDSQDDLVEPTVIDPISDDEPEANDEAEETEDGDDEDAGERAIEKSGMRFTKGLREALNAKYAESGIRFGERVSDAVTTLSDEIVRLREEVATLKSDKRKLESEAKDGRAYRSSLIAELKEEVIRSADSSEDKEAKAARYERLARTADIDTIKALRDDFAAVARSKYGSGRNSIDSEEGGNRKYSAIPDDAYDE